MKIPFNKANITGIELENLKKAIESRKLSGNRYFTQKCNNILEKKIGCKKAILTPSCSSALEMASFLCNISIGDEVIIPSYTFVTTVSSFVQRGAKIVWCDIREDTKNIDESKIERLITDKTKAIVVVHYGGIGCEIEKIQNICKNHNLFLIEDAAQAIDCYYKKAHLGSFGDVSTFSFHETKNIQCGEGGALIVNNPEMLERAEFLRDKGTNRILFDKGIVDKYTWVDLGSSFLMSELQAAFLYSQLEQSTEINKRRLSSWNIYYKLLSKFINTDSLPFIPNACTHNGHLFYILLDNIKQRNELIDFLKKNNIGAVFHYVPLHKAPFWKGKYDSVVLPITEKASERLLRLPLFFELKENEINFIAKKIREFLTI